jgi:hypothetical protein
MGEVNALGQAGERELALPPRPPVIPTGKKNSIRKALN